MIIYFAGIGMGKKREAVLRKFQANRLFSFFALSGEKEAYAFSAKKNYADWVEMVDEQGKDENI